MTLAAAGHGPKRKPWQLMWALAIAVYAVCKSSTWLAARIQAPAWKQAAYMLGWPGMDAASFLGNAPISRSRCRALEWRAAAARAACGAILVFGMARLIPEQNEYVAGWMGMTGLILMLHFGVFHLLSCLWRSLGAGARPLMDHPLASTSLSEFWGRRAMLSSRPTSRA